MRFINQTTIGSGILAYDWDFGDNTPNSSVANPQHTYAIVTGYPVTLRAISNGCVSEVRRNAYNVCNTYSRFHGTCIASMCGVRVFIAK